MKSIVQYGLSTLMALALTASSLTALAGTDYYRWTDEQGNTIHSDRPPTNGTDYEVVRSGGRFESAIADDEETAQEDEDDAAKERANGTSPSKSQKNPEMCEIAKENLAALVSKDKVAMRNDQGEVQELTAEQIQEHLKATHGQINAYCE